MAQQILMEKDGERLNVPGERLEEFLDAGWKEISREDLQEKPAAAKKPSTQKNAADKKPSTSKKPGAQKAAAAAESDAGKPTE